MFPLLIVNPSFPKDVQILPGTLTTSAASSARRQFAIVGLVWASSAGGQSASLIASVAYA